MKRIVVFGAAGFVGATFVEHMLARRGWEVIPCIHTSGGGWRLSPYGLEMPSVDVTDRDQVRQAVRGCSHVVNAVFGPQKAMINGLDHVLRACKDAGVERYVHISSVSAYGDREPGSLLQSSDPPSDRLTDYGKMKLEQDRMVEAACRRGLSSVILAPPNISGAYSPFLTRVLQALTEGRLSLVNGGELPCSLIDVQNLALALECALTCDRADATRLLVTDGESPSWKALVERLAPIADRKVTPPSITCEEAVLATRTEAPRASLGCSLRTLASILVAPHTRSILSQDPLIGKMYRWVAGATPEALKRRMRRVNERPRAMSTTSEVDAQIWDTHLLQVQLRAVRHSNDAAVEVLGYRPALNFERSMDAFESWYHKTYGYGDDSWEAFRAL